MVDVRPCTIRALFAAPEFAALCDEYTAECALLGMPRPNPSMEAYEQLEGIGVLHPYGAFCGGVLVGFVTLLVAPVPHYGGTPIVVTESLFVASRHRKTGAGMKMLRAAQQFTQDHSIPVMQVSAPHGSRLEKVLPRLGYEHTNSIFTKRFVHG